MAGRSSEGSTSNINSTRDRPKFATYNQLLREFIVDIYEDLEGVSENLDLGKLDLAKEELALIRRDIEALGLDNE